jgi:hypothetical protein
MLLQGRGHQHGVGIAVAREAGLRLLHDLLDARDLPRTRGEGEPRRSDDYKRHDPLEQLHQRILLG